MKRIKAIFLMVVLFAVTLSAQTEPDSTSFKKFQKDMKQLQEAAQKLDKEKYEFLGRYTENMINIQNQFQLINMYLEQEKKRLAELNKKK